MKFKSHLKRKKLSKEQLTKQLIVASKGLIGLHCKKCGLFVDGLTVDIVAVTCADCVQRMLEPPKINTKNLVDEKRPRGWQFMNRYVAPSGKIYSRGKEIVNEISKISSKDVSKKAKRNRTRKK